MKDDDLREKLNEILSGEDEQNNSLRRQTSSTSTSSNFSEQPSMDAIFEVGRFSLKISFNILFRI